MLKPTRGGPVIRWGSLGIPRGPQMLRWCSEGAPKVPTSTPRGSKTDPNTSKDPPIIVHQAPVKTLQKAKSSKLFSKLHFRHSRLLIF